MIAESQTTPSLEHPVREHPMDVIKEQAEDEALWFFAERITESILQKALRRLHAAVEGEPYYGQ